jgi:ABC-2 type transport system permease protein
MNTPLSPELLDPQQTSPAAMAQTRPMYWSIRREIWENRSIYLAPLIVAAIVLFSCFISVAGLPRKIRHLPAPDPVKLHAVVARPFSLAPATLMFTTLLVGLFYSLDALYGERRDRSILFWKSLPVSDRTTVLSKASIPLVVLPLIGLILALFAHYIVLLMSTVVLTASGISPGLAWSEFRFVEGPLVMIYGLTANVLWLAPIYCWLLLISAWARRTPLLWAVLPPFTIMLVEQMAFNTSSFARLLKYRVMGAMLEAFRVGPTSHGPINRFTQLDPVRFLTSPGLWLGLLFAAACLAAAIRLRRNREPS